MTLGPGSDTSFSMTGTLLENHPPASCEGVEKIIIGHVAVLNVHRGVAAAPSAHDSKLLKGQAQ